MLCIIPKEYKKSSARRNFYRKKIKKEYNYVSNLLLKSEVV